MAQAAGDAGAWPRLETALTRPIRWALVASQYDQMIKYATAIRTETASTEAILRRFAKANTVHPAYQAMAEVGRACSASLPTSMTAAFSVAMPGREEPRRVAVRPRLPLRSRPGSAATRG
jgi:hypothetical protein